MTGTSVVELKFVEEVSDDPFSIFPLAKGARWILARWQDKSP